MKHLVMAVATLVGCVAATSSAWAKEPNQGNTYIICKDGTQQFYNAHLGNNLNSQQMAENAAARQGAIDRCGSGNYSPVVSGPRAAPIGQGASVAVNPRSLGAVTPRVTLAQTAASLNELVASPRFIEMRRARDYRGMRDALGTIGVALEMPSEAQGKLCQAPRQWLWAQRFINHGQTESLSWVLVCGWPGDAVTL